MTKHKKKLKEVTKFLLKKYSKTFRDLARYDKSLKPVRRT